MRVEDAYAETLIKSSLDLVIAVDLPRKVLEFNPAAERAFGYGKAEVIGQPVDTLYSDPAVGVDAYTRVLSSGSFAGEVTNKRKNGEIFCAYLSASAVRDAQGQLVGVMGISRDITEHKRAEAHLQEMVTQLRQSHDDMRAILDQLRVGTVMTDEEGGISFLSQVAQRLLGQGQADVRGRPWPSVFSLQAEDKGHLQAMTERPAHRRAKVPVHLHLPGERHYWLEIDVQDDPRSPQRKIFYLYDVSEVHDLRRLLQEHARFYELVGKSDPMQRVYQQIQEVALVDATVLIEGETGTGKELVARAVHTASPRKDKPFIAVNCAGLIDSLLASQLFGHKRGAFTGAIADHQGVFETAHGGTLFLDELGDIPLTVQTSLLRVLQEKEIVRLGESRPRRINVRVLAATHRNLCEEATKGTFRSDLLYRLRVARIHLPPLRERRVDIPLLVESFLAQCRATTGKPVHEVSDEALRLLMAYSWPGNVRELRNAVEFAVIRCKGTVLHAADLPPELIESTPLHLHAGDTFWDGPASLLAALEKVRGNRAAAARLLGISRATLYRRLASLRDSPPTALPSQLSCLV